jgi:hypothetical protein
VRATTTPVQSARSLSAGLAAAALALTLVPGSAAADESREPVAVRVKVADQPPVDVATVPRVWPGQLLEVSGERKRLRRGDVVRLTDVVKERTTKRKKVRRGTVEVPTTELKPGRRKVVREGRPGVRKVVAMKTLHNGEPVKYRVVKKKMVRDPRPRRVLVGREPYAVPGTAGLNWGALADCESGGNPRAVNPAGYYGLYQFDVGTWRSVGGSGLPTAASAGEQTYRAKLLYKQRGRSPWPNCGRLL